MNRGRLTRYLLTFIGMLSLSGLCQAQQAPAGTPCTVSGQPNVIHDISMNGAIDPDPTDNWYTMHYDNTAVPPEFNLGLRGSAFGSSYTVSNTGSAINVSIEGAGIGAFNQTCGSPAFNQANVTAWYGSNNGSTGLPTVNGALVDTNNDRVVDSISLLLDFFQYPNLAGVLFDLALQYTTYMGVTYLVIPDPLPTPAGNVNIGGAWFIPVDPTNTNMVLQCGNDFGPSVIDDRAYITSNGSCIGSAIPVAGGWGAALLALALLAAGIWTMRRGGMGKGIALS
jgi:hypothetical protein